MNLPFLMTSDEVVSSKILGYLGKKEIARVGMVCQDLKNSVSKFNSNISNDDYAVWRANKIEQLRRAKKNGKTGGQQTMKFIETENNFILKTRLFDVPLRFLDSSNWADVDETDEIFARQIKTDKFIKEHNNLFYKNKRYDDILFINRSVVDASLNFNEEDELAAGGSADTSEKYAQLYEGGEFSADKYDFSDMQSLLSRQRQIISQFTKKEEKIQQEIAAQANCLNSFQTVKKITIILCHGGFFSIGIYDEKGNCLFHKSDHKYVVRKKAGKRQLNLDTQSGKTVKSMGSQIRRDQEKKHQEKVTSILTDHIEEIEATDIVFLQAPGINKLLLVRENQPLMRVQHKLRSICLTAKKANYTEVERIFKAITKVYLVLDKNVSPDTAKTTKEQTNE